jgi:hypothetical protein
MSTFIRVIEGTYRAQSVADMVFPLVSDYKQTAAGNKFVTVNASEVISGTNNIRVNVESRKSFVVVAEAEYIAQQEETEAVVEQPKVETDGDILARLEERFNVLDLMTQAVIAGDVRGLVVTGPPGVGKSYGVEQELEKAGLFDKVAGKRTRYHIVKGASTALGLYAALYKYSDKGNVLVFDDCDDLFGCEISLNLLKGALDSGKKRRLAWNSSSSSFLEKEGIPDSFLFHGTVIFISNLKLEAARGKMAAHMEALMSRCHYLDLTMDTMREKLLRIEQVASQGNLFQDYNFSKEDEAEVMAYMKENKDKFREMSIRTALKISDLKKIAPTQWESLARSTCMKRICA